jgi:hypothetical protein
MFAPIRQVSRVVWLVCLALLGLALPMLASAQRCPQGQYYDRDENRCAFPAPNVVNDLWNAIAYSPSSNIAAFAGSYTAPANAKAEALKGCAEWARDCRIIVAAHDVCVAVGYERAPGSLYRSATAATKQDAQGKALSAECKAAGPQRCRVLAGCTGTPPRLLISK